MIGQTFANGPSPNTPSKLDQALVVPGGYVITLFNATTAGFGSINVSSLSNPTLVNSFVVYNPVNYGPFQGKILGNYLYAGTNNGRSYLYVINISTPTTLTFTNGPTATLIDSGGSLGGLDVVGTNVFMTSETTGKFFVVNASTPSAPTITSTTTTGNVNLIGVRVIGNYAYIASYTNNTLLVYNISNLSLPVLANTPVTNFFLTNPAGIAIDPSGNYLYINSYGGNTLWVVDVGITGSPTNPVLISTLTIPGPATIAIQSYPIIQGTSLYVGLSSPAGIAIFNISTPTAVTMSKLFYLAYSSASQIDVDSSGNIYTPNRSNMNPSESLLQIYSPSYTPTTQPYINLIGQSGSINGEAIYYPSATAMYQISLYAACTLATAGNSIVISLYWIDSNSLFQTLTLISLALTATTNYQQQTVVASLLTGTSVYYMVAQTGSGAQYSLAFRIVSLD